MHADAPGSEGSPAIVRRSWWIAGVVVAACGGRLVVDQPVVPDPVRKLRVDEAWISMDAGTVVNEDRVHAQMEGGLIMGISNALYGGVTLKRGRVEQSNFRDARICRIGDVPRRIHTDLVRGDGPPCGVGEPPVPPVGAALANAVFALTGRRIRELPIARALGI